MVITNGHTTTPHRRPNRRRERPGSRTRRTVSRKSHLQSCLEEECHEAILDARDASFILPSNKTNPSPLLRENFDQSWQRWQTKKAEQVAHAERERLRIEQEQILLFGGDLNDEELYRLGILYDEESTHNEDNSVACHVPSQHPSPLFVIRPGKPRRSRRSNQLSRPPSLPLYLSFSEFRADADIARLLSKSPTPTIQHRQRPISIPSTAERYITSNTPLSLPPTMALKPAPHSDSHLHSHPHLIPIPAHQLQPDTEDWTFISSTHHHTTYSTAPSEPETWILLSDDS